MVDGLLLPLYVDRTKSSGNGRSGESVISLASSLRVSRAWDDVMKAECNAIECCGISGGSSALLLNLPTFVSGVTSLLDCQDSIYGTRAYYYTESADWSSNLSLPVSYVYFTAAFVSDRFQKSSSYAACRIVDGVEIDYAYSASSPACEETLTWSRYLKF